MKKLATMLILTTLIAVGPLPRVFASDARNMAYIQRGAGRVLGSTLAIPAAILQDSGRVMFPFGIVTGVIRGTARMVSGIIGGTMDMVCGGAPYAKYAALAL
ncbi:MAG TPA: hypothetical protein PK997_06290 [Candidatus Omnitrophota bacterium]|nr:MAG: hypothetical protein BWY49_00709 [Candidatus Omnitrophica bacterium ADurb.Bin314]HPW64805.1 hypothetical protein [Candidatus Omnitrophota bacterium]HQB94803.1 hypothetical protein [Candidatus Omnitrophota bacterium]